MSSNQIKSNQIGKVTKKLPVSSVDSENETSNYIEDIEELLRHNREPYV